MHLLLPFVLCFPLCCAETIVGNDSNEQDLKLILNNLLEENRMLKFELKNVWKEIEGTNARVKTLENELEDTKHELEITNNKCGFKSLASNGDEPPKKGENNWSLTKRSFPQRIKPRPDRQLPESVAFSVALNTHKENLGQLQTVEFDTVVTNVGGGYDKNTSIFKAPIEGLYHFDVVIMSHYGEDVETEIVKNGHGIVRTYSGNGDTWGVGVQSTVVQLNTGDDVWVRILNNPGVNDGNVRVYGQLWSSFSGFLVV